MANLLDVFAAACPPALSAGMAGLDELARFAPLRALDDESQLALLQVARLATVADQQVLFYFQDRDDYDYFLISGRVKLVAADGRIHRVEAGTVMAQQPLARLRPRQYTGVVEGGASLLVVGRETLQRLQGRVTACTEGRYGVEELEDSELGAGSEAMLLFRAFRDDVKAFRVHLPDLPPSVAEIRRLSRMGSSDAAAFARATAASPALENYLIRAASNRLFSRERTCSDCADAVGRLGVQQASELALAFTPALLRARCGADWDAGWLQSLEVAAAGWWLADSTGLVSPHQAIVLGLLHNAGMPLAVRYLGAQQALALSGAAQRDVLPLLCRDITRFLLLHWGVDDIYVQNLPPLYDWQQAGESSRPGLCDLLQSARYLQLLVDRDPGLPCTSDVAGLGRAALYQQELLQPDTVWPAISEIMENLQAVFHA